MSLVRGWLYIGRTAATFVSDERCYISDKVRWQFLAKHENLSDFLSKFPAVKEDQRSSYKSYYIEVDGDALVEWFSGKTI